MDDYTTAFAIIASLLLLWILLGKPSGSNARYGAGFQNNDYYFNGNENDSMYIGRLIQPRLIHKINIPAEW